MYKVFDLKEVPMKKGFSSMPVTLEEKKKLKMSVEEQKRGCSGREVNL